jgi:hypothetical protein
MTAPKDDDDPFIHALREDLPSATDEARVRARLLAAGLIAGGALSSSSAAAASGAALASKAVASQAGFLSKLALLPTAAKVGIATVALAGVSLPLVVERLERAEPIVAQAVAAKASAASAPLRAPAAPSAAPAPARASVLPARLAEPEPVKVPAMDPLAVAPATKVRPRGATEEQGSVHKRTVSVRATKSRGHEGDVPVAAEVVAAPSAPAIESKPAVAAEPLPAVAAAPVADAPPSPAPPSTLGEETEIMERALTALAAGDHDHARYWLMEHARRFPDGLLQHERVRIRERLEREHRSKRD